MYFKFIILSVSFLLIVNPLLGAPGSSRVHPVQQETGEDLDELIDQTLERAYNFVKYWWSIPDTRNLTLNEFFQFAGKYPIRRALVNQYFQENPAAFLNHENIDIPLFKELMKTICNGTGLDPILFPNNLMTTL